MMGHGFFGGMWLWPLLIIVAIVACVAMMGGWGRWQRSFSQGTRGDAREILRARYAAGELTKEEFEQMKRDLK